MNFSINPARRISDPGAPELRLDVTIVVGVAWLIALVVATQVGGQWGELAVLGAWMVVGELLAVQLMDGTSFSLATGLLLPLIVVTGPLGVAATAGAAAALAAPARRPRSIRVVGTNIATRVTSGLVACGAYRVVMRSTGGTGSAAMLGALVAAAGALFIVELGFRYADQREPLEKDGGYAAALAVGASGLLTAVGLRGIDGVGAMGLWAVPVFAVPALSARWAFGRLHAIRRTYDQTVDVLSAVPEMGGRVRPGHSKRVASLSLDIARLVELPRAAMVDLERAALLHALGSVTLDDEEGEAPATPAQIATATYEVLQDETPLSGPASLVAGIAGRPLVDGDQLAGEILRAATAYEALAGGDPTRWRAAVGVVTSGRECRDRRVLAALARVVSRRALAGKGAGVHS